MSKNFSSSITTYISSDLNKLIFPDFSHVKLWLERSLSLVGRYAAALVADWVCTLLVIDVGTYRSRQWLQGKAQLSSSGSPRKGTKGFPLCSGSLLRVIKVRQVK